VNVDDVGSRENVVHNKEKNYPTASMKPWEFKHHLGKCLPRNLWRENPLITLGLEALMNLHLQG